MALERDTAMGEGRPSDLSICLYLSIYLFFLNASSASSLSPLLLLQGKEERVREQTPPGLEAVPPRARFIVMVDALCVLWWRDF